MECILSQNERAVGNRRYWLLKSDPAEFSIRDLKESPDQTACWDGIRNYQARNILRNEMQKGDAVLFYHSQVNPAIVGTAMVVRDGYPDHTVQGPSRQAFRSPEYPGEPHLVHGGHPVGRGFQRTPPTPLPSNRPGIEEHGASQERQQIVRAAGNEGGIRGRSVSGGKQGCRYPPKELKDRKSICNTSVAAKKDRNGFVGSSVTSTLDTPPPEKASGL